MENVSTIIELLVFFAVVAGVLYAAMKVRRNTSYRMAIGLALMAVFIMIYINLAVGIIGEPDHVGNLAYFSVPLLGFVGALVVRFRPDGMFKVMLAAALLQCLVFLLSIFAGWAQPASWAWALLLLNGVFALLWLGSALLFRRAASQLQMSEPAN